MNKEEETVLSINFNCHCHQFLDVDVVVLCRFLYVKIAEEKKTEKRREE